jgi:hypothetical protein
MFVLNRSRDIDFWILISFLPTFLIARLLVYANPHLFLNIRGTHVHHYTYGIILLALAGLISLNVKETKWKVPVAVMYGVGLALSFDEFGMWLHLEDDYWVRQSYDAIIIISTLLIGIIYFSYFWAKLINKHK